MAAAAAVVAEAGPEQRARRDAREEPVLVKGHLRLVARIAAVGRAVPGRRSGLRGSSAPSRSSVHAAGYGVAASAGKSRLLASKESFMAAGGGYRRMRTVVSAKAS